MPSFSVPSLNVLRSQLPAFSSAQQGATRLILEAPELSLEQSVGTLAVRVSVSVSTIVRMCQVLDFGSLREFEATLTAELVHTQPILSGYVGWTDSLALVTSKVIDSATRALAKLHKLLSTAQVDVAAERIARARRVDCYATDTASSFMTNDMQAQLMRLGLASNAYFDTHLQLVSATILGASNVVVVFSHVRCMLYLLESIAYTAERGACVIVITQAGTSLVGCAQTALAADVPEDTMVRVSTETYLVYLTIIKILITCVVRCHGEMVRARVQAIQWLLIECSIDHP